MRPLGRALGILAALGLFAGIGAVTLILTSHHMSHRGTWAAFAAALGGSFVGTGLYAWWRRPHNRSGALMTWVGFLWFLAALPFSDVPAIFIAGQFTAALPIAGLAHLALAVPSGRLASRYQRRLIASGYLTATLIQVPGILFLDTRRDSICDGCPGNPILLQANAGIADAGAAIVNVCAVAVLALVTYELVRGVRRARGAEREVYAPVAYAGAATLSAFAFLFGSALIGGPGASVLRILAFATFLTVPYAFLAGVLRGRLSRATAVAELVESLGQADGARASLRDSIAAALADSSLMLAYWVSEAGAYVDADGRPVTLPQDGDDRAATAIERGGEPLAVVIHDAALADERDLVRAVGGAAALTLENERLSAELRARINELRASRARLVQAGDDARRRLERDLHDGAQQRLVALALNLQLARSSSDLETARGRIEEASDELNAATAELRELARGIHPAVLTDRGLGVAVDALAGRAQVPVTVSGTDLERLSPPVEATAYFVVAEALTNVARYARASRAEVALERLDGSLAVEVRDDGIGGADPARGSGLRGLADRVAALDGRLTVTSEHGAGTIVRVELPCGR